MEIYVGRDTYQQHLEVFLAVSRLHRNALKRNIAEKEYKHTHI